MLPLYVWGVGCRETCWGRGVYNKTGEHVKLQFVHQKKHKKSKITFWGGGLYLSVPKKGQKHERFKQKSGGNYVATQNILKT